MPRLHPGRSIRRSMLVCVLLPQFLLWLAGCGLGWLLAERHSQAMLDQSLLTQARALSASIRSDMPPDAALAGLHTDFQLLAQFEPTERPTFWLSIHPGTLSAGTAPIPLPPAVSAPHAQPAGEPRLYDLMQSGIHRRAVLLQQPLDNQTPGLYLRIQIARDIAPTHTRTHGLLAWILPSLTALWLLLSTGSVIAVQRGLLPLRKLVDEIDGIQSGDLRPVVLPHAPHEIQSITDALNHLLGRVQHSMDAEKRFIGDAAHQLHTPLAGLISQAELALTETDTAKRHDRIVKMHSAAQRSAHLVQQMLALARAESAPLQPAQRYDIAALAHDVVREWTPRAQAAHIHLGYTGNAHAHVLGYRTLMREAIGNLIDNAIQYAGHDTAVTVSVRLQDAAGQRQVVLEVCDNGPGVAAEHLPQLFERLWRADDSIAGGCGIGLALVDQVAALHNATVQSLSTEPSGLTVRLTLPQASH